MMMTSDVKNKTLNMFYTWKNKPKEPAEKEWIHSLKNLMTMTSEVKMLNWGYDRMYW